MLPSCQSSPAKTAPNVLLGHDGNCSRPRLMLDSHSQRDHGENSLTRARAPKIINNTGSMSDMDFSPTDTVATDSRLRPFRE